MGFKGPDGIESWGKRKRKEKISKIKFINFSVPLAVIFEKLKHRSEC